MCWQTPGHRRDPTPCGAPPPHVSTGQMGLRKAGLTVGGGRGPILCHSAPTEKIVQPLASSLLYNLLHTQSLEIATPGLGWAGGMMNGPGSIS